MSNVNRAPYAWRTLDEIVPCAFAEIVRRRRRRRRCRQCAHLPENRNYTFAQNEICIRPQRTGVCVCVLCLRTPFSGRAFLWVEGWQALPPVAMAWVGNLAPIARYLCTL